MTQVVAEPAYLDIMRSLMLCSEGGSELYLRNPASVNIQTGAGVHAARAGKHSACICTPWMQHAGMHGRMHVVHV